MNNETKTETQTQTQNSSDIFQLFIELMVNEERHWSCRLDEIQEHLYNPHIKLPKHIIVELQAAQTKANEMSTHFDGLLKVLATLSAFGQYTLSTALPQQFLDLVGGIEVTDPDAVLELHKAARFDEDEGHLGLCKFMRTMLNENLHAKNTSR